MGLQTRSFFRQYSGMSVLLLLSSYLFLTALPKETLFLRALTAKSTDSETSTMTVRIPDSPILLPPTSMKDHGFRLPSKDFFVQKPSVTMMTRDSMPAEVGEQSHLKIAWLMSFPNSGTSYTITLLRRLTLTSTATNYGHEVIVNDGFRSESKAVYSDQPTGPYWYEPVNQTVNYTRPHRYVLTKTHCGLRCESCPPQSYVETTFSFRHNCMSGGRYNASGHKELVTYPPDKVAKAIHLIRNPFDNVVSRFHLERRKTMAMQERYDPTKKGFLEFCRDMNEAYRVEEDRAPFIHQSILATLTDVPCRADFIRYIEWHNLAFVTTQDMGLETWVLKYDWYAKRFNETVRELVEFLDVPIRDEPEPFVRGKVYHDYFTDDQRWRVKLAQKAMASKESWKHIGPYFEAL